MDQCVKVGVSLSGNYERQAKPTWPVLRVHGWTQEHGDRLLAHVRENARYENMRWLEDGLVQDAEPEESLPDVLYVVVTASKVWDGHIGGTSWYANTAFTSEEAANAYARKWEQPLYWYWVMPARRFTPTS